MTEGGVCMATSSITKDFYVKDQAAFERLKKELESTPVRTETINFPSFWEGRDLLATFVFCSKK